MLRCVLVRGRVNYTLPSCTLGSRGGKRRRERSGTAGASRCEVECSLELMEKGQETFVSSYGFCHPVTFTILSRYLQCTLTALRSNFSSIRHRLNVTPIAPFPRAKGPFPVHSPACAKARREKGRSKCAEKSNGETRPSRT